MENLEMHLNLIGLEMIEEALSKEKKEEEKEEDNGR